MSIVQPGIPPASTAQQATGRMRPRNENSSHWLFYLHFLACFVAIFAFKVWSNKYTSNPANIEEAETAVQIAKSPLQQISWQSAFDSISKADQVVLSDIETKAALDIKFFALPETIYSITEADGSDLSAYIESQMKLMGDVITPVQAEAVLKMVESRAAQGTLVKKEIGIDGTLKNSMVLALMKQQDDKVHFALTAVSVEPKLGWRFITKKERNQWNSVLNKMADERLRQETSKLFGDAANAAAPTTEESFADLLPNSS